MFLDDAQFSNQGMHNYHYIKTPQGSFRIKIPVEYTTGDQIKEVIVKDQLNWRQKHIKIIEMNYKKAPFFNLIFSDFINLLENTNDNLSAMNINFIIFICDKLKIQCEFVKSSDLIVTGDKESRVIEICKSLKADTYISGTGAKVYQNNENFKSNGLDLVYTNFKPFEYSQLWASPFLSNVSILDYLMHNGYDWNLVLKNNIEI